MAEEQRAASLRPGLCSEMWESLHFFAISGYIVELV